jgi:hypothetical protein
MLHAGMSQESDRLMNQINHYLTAVLDRIDDWHEGDKNAEAVDPN